jgi:hypothetical protein
VLVRTGYHDDIIALDAVVADEYVSRQISPGDMPQVQAAVGVRPGYGD